MVLALVLAVLVYQLWAIMHELVTDLTRRPAFPSAGRADRAVPEIGIDWSRAHVPLDQELRQFLGDSQTRKRQVDRLYRVTVHDGTEEHLFLHVAIVILAQRAALRRVQSPGERKTLKWDLTRRLYERGYCREEVVELFRLIDWLLTTPTTRCRS